MSRKILIAIFLLLVSGYFQTHSKVVNNHESNNQKKISLNIKSNHQSKNEEKSIIHPKCGVKSNEIGYTDMRYDSNDIISNHRSHRKKREFSANRNDLDSNNSYTIEVLVAVDESMQRFHRSIGSDITEYVLSLIFTTANIFADASIGNMMHIAIVGIVNLNGNLIAKPLHEGKDAESMLRKFQEFMNKNKSKYREYDVGLLLTREKLCSNQKCQTSGIGTVSGMCTPQSYAVVEDAGLSKGHTIAHEFGHLLSALHDDDNECSKFLHDEQMHTMASVSRPGNKMWSWSNCSRHFITQFVEDERGSCLSNWPSYNMLKLHPIDITNSNRQCQLAYGKSSKAKLVFDSMISCKQMHCTTANQIYMPYADGTECDVGKWCYRGECLEFNNPEQFNGGWSEWKISGQCTRSCGGGIQWYARECNRPVPKNGGKYCVGRHRTYKSCNTNDCSMDMMDFRDHQCIALNDRTHSWSVAYNVHKKDQCKLACKNKYTNHISWLREKVIDGTACNQNTYHKCINGICRPAGCDNKLNSKLRLNKCGVCSSNNDICTLYSQTYSAKQIRKLNKYKKHTNYYYVTNIPKGATNVEIIQFGYRGDENYFVFGNDKQEYTRFGNPFINANANYIYDGQKFVYVSNETVIKITTLPFTHLLRNLTIQIFLAGEPKEDLIRYSYWIQNEYQLNPITFGATAHQQGPNIFTLLITLLMIVFIISQT